MTKKSLVLKVLATFLLIVGVCLVDLNTCKEPTKQHRMDPNIARDCAIFYLREIRSQNKEDNFHLKVEFLYKYLKDANLSLQDIGSSPEEIFDLLKRVSKKQNHK